MDHLPLYAPYPGPGNLTHEMLGVRTWLNETCGIPLEDMVGFRCPYLAHDPPVREVLFEAGLTYDSSILEYGRHSITIYICVKCVVHFLTDSCGCCVVLVQVLALVDVALLC